MEPLVTAFVAVFLSGWGDKTQLIVALLAARSGRPGLVLAGLIVAALASNLVAAWAGTMIGATIPPRAVSLMVALALLLGGLGAFLPRTPPSLGSMKLPLLLVAAILCLAAETGSRGQFLTFALAARFDSVWLAMAGASAGLLAATAPAALLGDRLARAVPLRAIRFTVGGLFLVIGFIVAMQALRLA